MSKASDTIFFIIASLIVIIITTLLKAVWFILSWVWKQIFK